jgi:DNA mismatch repair protein MutS
VVSKRRHKARASGDATSGNQLQPPDNVEPAATTPEQVESGAASENSAAGPVGPSVTPMMLQYSEIKAANSDSLLFYRMGDFYELFFEDAIVASAALGITLTKRGKHLGDDIPMCGVPVHAADDYLQKLIRKGFRVAVCEQSEDPAEARKRGSKAVVRRDVVRLVTPGTLTEDTLLDARRNNFLTALFRAPGGHGEPGRLALASLDISTGEFWVGDIALNDLVSELSRFAPSELLIADTIVGEPWLKTATMYTGAAVTPIPKAHFDSIAGERALKSRLGVADLGAFGELTRGELAAIGAVLKYVELTQIGRSPVLSPPKRSSPQSVLVFDPATRANLELARTSGGERQGSLLAALDRTVTGAGARELASRLASPLRVVAEINGRLDAVGYLLDDSAARADIRSTLKSAPDMGRALSRLSLGRGSPRDLSALRDGLTAASAIRDRLLNSGSGLGLPMVLSGIQARLGSKALALLDVLKRALIDEPPTLARDGGFVREGHSKDLDDNRQLRDQSRQVLAAMQGELQVETSLKSLKIRHNNVLGYFIEVPARDGKALQAEQFGGRFFHRQTIAAAMRFSTAQLAEAEGKITSAADRALALELEVFDALTRSALEHQAELTATATALADLDATAGLAELAEVERYSRPTLDESLAFEITAGRHPVVEQALRNASDAPFIENDCVLGKAGALGSRTSTPDRAYPEASAEHDMPGFDDGGDPRLWIVTGPNMAGKSTFLRQNAIIAILAQMGSFVPARHAHIGVLDRLFSRVGASDDLARGRSTFMVEMVETAAILNQASERSLVILDEIGRGTATFDGLSIAWACVEYLHEVNRCRALFATHYHELTALGAKLPHAANATIEVKEWQDEILFLHKVVPGTANRSYGIQVARLAGLPRAVTDRAGEVLRLLEEEGQRASPDDLVADLPLFAARPTASKPQASTPRDDPSFAVVEALAKLNPDELTPRQALDSLYSLKGLLPKIR